MHTAIYASYGLVRQTYLSNITYIRIGNSGTVVRDAGEKTKGNVDMAKTSSKSVSAAKSATLVSPCTNL